MTYNSKWLEKAHEKMKSTGVYFDAKKIFFFLFSFVFNTVDVVGRDAGLGGGRTKVWRKVDGTDICFISPVFIMEGRKGGSSLL